MAIFCPFVTDSHSGIKTQDQFYIKYKGCEKSKRRQGFFQFSCIVLTHFIHNTNLKSPKIMADTIEKDLL
nr:MAG TPA: hypothetical protein [Caudoviricetes sp.]